VTDDVDVSGPVLADLELTRGLAVQMSAVGTLGTVVAWTAIAGLYRLATGLSASLWVFPTGLGPSQTR
jgi:hypothetical protein